jgi:hypothetical protein
MTGPSLEAANVHGRKPQIEVTIEPAAGALKTLSVAPFSINICEFEVQPVRQG